MARTDSKLSELIMAEADIRRRHSSTTPDRSTLCVGSCPLPAFAESAHADVRLLLEIIDAQREAARVKGHKCPGCGAQAGQRFRSTQPAERAMRCDKCGHEYPRAGTDA